MKVSAIIPIFNEEKTLTKVIKVLLKNKLITEVICVNDGSTDSSPQLLKKFDNQIKVINLKKNYGKGKAMAEGIQLAKGEVVSFFDADLINLYNQHILQLIKPLLNKKVNGSIGVLTTKNSIPIIWPQFSGIRAYFKKDLIKHLAQMRKTKYGVEMFLNKLFKKKVVKKVNLKGLKYLRKFKKRGNKEAFKEYFKMSKEIAKEMVK